VRDRERGAVVGRVWGLCRVSSPGQEREGTSLEGQQQAIAGWCARERLPAPIFIVEVESGTAARVEHREGLRRILLEASEGDVVVVYALDRWSRDLVYTMQSVRALVARGVRWYAIREALDATTQEGDSRLGLMGWIAEEERKRISERTHGRIRELRDEGKYVDGAVWVGYVVEDRRLVPGPQRAIPVEAFERCARGESMARIAAALPLTPGRKTWDRGAVHHMLTSRVYLGESRKSDGTWHATHEPLVSRDLWERAHAAMRERRTGGRPHGDGLSAERLLRGLARCAACGRRMSVQYGRPRQRGGRAMRYVCTGVLRRACHTRHVHAERLDALVADAALDRLIELRHELARAVPPRAPEPDVVDHAAKIAAVKAKRERLISLAVDGTITKADLRTRLAKLDADVGRLEHAAAEHARRHDAQERASRPEVRAEHLGRVEVVRQTWARMPVAHRREALAVIATRIEVVSPKRKWSHEVPEPRIVWRTVEELLTAS
jgi:DNA invertase Pin-like site-specific DNA recombinase